jgi:hypothetical protein
MAGAANAAAAANAATDIEGNAEPSLTGGRAHVSDDTGRRWEWREVPHVPTRGVVRRVFLETGEVSLVAYHVVDCPGLSSAQNAATASAAAAAADSGKQQRSVSVQLEGCSGYSACNTIVESGHRKLPYTAVQVCVKGVVYSTATTFCPANPC